MELEGERSEALGILYGVLRTCWTRRGDQMVTGAASTASSATAGVRPWWERGYGAGTRGKRGGNGGGAHRGCSGRRSGLGDALETANRWRWWSEPEEEDEGDGGSTGRPASCGLTESFRARGRSSYASREGEGRPVAAAMANGGDGCVRTRGCRLKMNCRPSLNYMSSASVLPLHSICI